MLLPSSTRTTSSAGGVIVNNYFNSCTKRREIAMIHIQSNIHKNQCFFLGFFFSSWVMYMRASLRTVFGINIHIKRGIIIASSTIPRSGKISGRTSTGLMTYIRESIAMMSFVPTGVLSSIYARASMWISLRMPRIFLIFCMSFIVGYMIIKSLSKIFWFKSWSITWGIFGIFGSKSANFSISTHTYSEYSSLSMIPHSTCRAR